MPDSDLDARVDIVAGAMTAGTPSARLRHKVSARIGTSPHLVWPGRWLVVAGGAAAAAVVLGGYVALMPGRVPTRLASTHVDAPSRIPSAEAGGSGTRREARSSRSAGAPAVALPSPPSGTNPRPGGRRPPVQRPVIDDVSPLERLAFGQLEIAPLDTDERGWPSPNPLEVVLLPEPEPLDVTPLLVE